MWFACDLSSPQATLRDIWFALGRHAVRPRWQHRGAWRTCTSARGGARHRACNPACAPFTWWCKPRCVGSAAAAAGARGVPSSASHTAGAGAVSSAQCAAGCVHAGAGLCAGSAWKERRRMAAGVPPFASAPLSPAGPAGVGITVGRPRDSYVPKEPACALLALQTSGNLHGDQRGAYRRPCGQHRGAPVSSFAESVSQPRWHPR
jgi:hypothetical protein